jgi:hypothetical protein
MYRIKKDECKVLHIARNRHYFILVCFLSLLTGCFKSTPTLPDWVENKPQDNLAYFAIGQGVNLYDAEMNARSALAAELSSTVSDLTTVYSVDDGKFQQQIFEQFTSVEVSKVSLSHASVSQQQISGHQYFVLLKMLKGDLAVQLKNELKAEVRKVEVVVKQSSSESFEKWWKLRQVLPGIKRITHNIALLEQIEGKAYSREARLVKIYFEKFDNSYRVRALQIKNQTKNNNIYALVSQQLQLENIAIADASFWKSKDHVEISSEYSQQKIGQEFYVEGVLWLRLKSSGGQVLSEFSLEGRGVSYRSAKQSKEMADQVLYNKLKKLEIITKLVD